VATPPKFAPPWPDWMPLCVAKRKKLKQLKPLLRHLWLRSLCQKPRPKRPSIQPRLWQRCPQRPMPPPMLRRLNKQTLMQMPMPLPQQMRPLKPQRLWRHTSPPNPWWLCGVTTVPVKRK
jgi:hypothetical protein